jgi:uncharacterized protein (DUF362 family)
LSGQADSLAPPFARPRSRVAIRRVSSYDADLPEIIFETLREFDLAVRGKSVLLKPNLVESDEIGAINTHPAVIGAAREAFLKLGAARVLVGEAPAHERDTEAIAEAIRLSDHIGPLDANFVDLNVDEVHRVPLRTRASKLGELYLPRTVLEADFFVSMPKMKTHHWAGVTLSMKNLFGVVPGSCYGWPKNILHWAGIDRAILDLTSTVRPAFAIVDGIIGMEGNGPIQGKPKAAGVLILGEDPVAVDATAARVMGILPEKVDYLAQAGYLLGHTDSEKIQQIGESVASVCTPFELLERFEKLRG